MKTDFISPLSTPFYWFIGITILAFLTGLWRYQVNIEDRVMTLVTLFWATGNILLLLGSLGALFEIRQRRTNPRLDVNINAKLVVTANHGASITSIPVSVRDLSVGGASIAINSTADPFPIDCSIKLSIDLPVTSSNTVFNVSVVTKSIERENQIVGIKFNPANLQEYKSIVLLVHGDSSKWSEITKQHDFDPGIGRGIIFLINAGIKHSIRHLFSFFHNPVKLTSIFSTSIPGK